MPLTRNLGTRVELVAMDPQFHNITIALYRQDQSGKPEYLVHTYSSLPGAAERLESFRSSMCILGELEKSGEVLHFPCGAAHQAGAKRTFLETGKLSGPATAPKPLTVFDKRTGRNMAVTSLGAGRYQITADGPDDGKAARIEAVVGGLVRLAEVQQVDGSPGQFTFPCGNVHDALVGLLLPRALNVRAILREEESAGGRGLLAAPSQQK